MAPGPPAVQCLMILSVRTAFPEGGLHCKRCILPSLYPLPPHPPSEHDNHFCQWVIAGEAGHPVFRRTVELIVERAKKGIDMKSDHFVHAHTGPGACVLYSAMSGAEWCEGSCVWSAVLNTVGSLPDVTLFPCACTACDLRLL